jgi:hypothetical protein
MPELPGASKAAHSTWEGLCKLAAASPTTFSNMGVVSRPVFVFWREQ